MANLMDYMVWRGDLGFGISPWNDVDALIMANLCYLNFQGIDDRRGWTVAEAKRQGLMQYTVVASFESRKAQFEAMADTRRFGGIRMHHFINLTDGEQRVQFSAVCYDLPDGALCIGFRGTDGTLTGWREDLDMSYEDRVPAQEAALFYLEKAAELDDRPIRLVGHSKGGNLAVFAAACCAPEIQDRLEAVYSFDGPGMAPDVFQSEGYLRVAGKIRSFVPQTSIVGMMMNYHRVYTVVRSDASGIGQHDPHTWQVYGPRFETAEEIDANAKAIRDTMKDLLEKTERGERADVVDAVFTVLENTGASNLAEMKEGGIHTITGVAMGARNLDPEDRKKIMKLSGLLLSQGFGNLADRYRARRAEARQERLEAKLGKAEAKQEKPEEEPETQETQDTAEEKTDE